ncbi:hypothetical protein ACH4FX_11985 [Streptomyces sp. NPDC018019]|uniref:hypothetical protein n=1 Tax=Streptomyces sp. NPDC018019 TaxID=3365030 RepID=UPI0037AA7E91
MPEPYAWTWTEDGIRRQAKIHVTRDDRTVVWSPRFLGDPRPWFDADYAEGDPAAYFEDADLLTLGIPVAAWSGFDG